MTILRDSAHFTPEGRRLLVSLGVVEPDPLLVEAERWLLERPGKRAIQQLFGSWSAFMREAGIAPSPGSHEASFSEEQCVAAIRAVTKDLGFTPTRDQYDRHRKRVIGAASPSRSTILRRIGAWSEATRKAGL